MVLDAITSNELPLPMSHGHGVLMNKPKSYRLQSLKGDMADARNTGKSKHLNMRCMCPNEKGTTCGPARVRC